jgi:hypothetical protein
VPGGVPAGWCRRVGGCRRVECRRVVPVGGCRRVGCRGACGWGAGGRARRVRQKHGRSRRHAVPRRHRRRVMVTGHAFGTARHGTARHDVGWVSAGGCRGAVPAAGSGGWGAGGRARRVCQKHGRSRRHAVPSRHRRRVMVTGHAFGTAQQGTARHGMARHGTARRRVDAGGWMPVGTGVRRSGPRRGCPRRSGPGRGCHRRGCPGRGGDRAGRRVVRRRLSIRR